MHIEHVAGKVKDQSLAHSSKTKPKFSGSAGHRLSRFLPLPKCFGSSAGDYTLSLPY